MILRQDHSPWVSYPPSTFWNTVGSLLFKHSKGKCSYIPKQDIAQSNIVRYFYLHPHLHANIISYSSRWSATKLSVLAYQVVHHEVKTWSSMPLTNLKVHDYTIHYFPWVLKSPMAYENFAGPFLFKHSKEFVHTPGGAHHCQVEHHVQLKKMYIYFLHKASPKWVKFLSVFFSWVDIHNIYYIVRKMVTKFDVLSFFIKHTVSN